MKRLKNKFQCSVIAQTAVEFIFLFSVVVTIVLIGYHTYLPRIKNASETYFKNSVNAIVGPLSPCGDGVCNSDYGERENCSIDC